MSIIHHFYPGALICLVLVNDQGAPVNSVGSFVVNGFTSLGLV